MRRTAKTPLSKLKKRLWAITREIIILLHGTTCYTCGKTNLEKQNLQIGHYIPSSVCSVEMRYDVQNLRPQCYRCNIHLSGNWLAYEIHLQDDGIDPAELKRRNEVTKGFQYDTLYYNAKIQEYTDLRERLLQRNDGGGVLPHDSMARESGME